MSRGWRGERGERAKGRIQIFDSAWRREAVPYFLGAGLAAVALLLGGHGNAVADSNADEAFLATLIAGGIQWPAGGDDAIREAQATCGLLDRGLKEPVAVEVITGDGLSLPDASYFVGATIASYCPWDKHMIADSA